MNDDRRKMLTEYIGECWHESDQTDCVGRQKLNGGTLYQKCKHCNKIMSSSFERFLYNRTFTTESDMIALYRNLWKAVGMQSWYRFYDEAMDIYHEIHNPCECLTDTGGFTAWLFCLSGSGYDERCQMVYEFLKGEENETN